MKSLPNRQNDSLRLVLVWPSTSLILVERWGGAFRLPRISIPRWTRVAWQIQAVIREQWGNQGIVIETIAGDGSGESVAVVEVLSGDVPTSGERISSMRDLDDGELSTSERLNIERLLARNPVRHGPFARFGWIDEALAWITSVTSIERQDLVKDVLQFNGSADFALLRFGTPDRYAYWLKAVGEPNLIEFPVTLKLSELLPDFLPSVVASRRDWNAWLMRDAGKPLDELLTLSAAKRTMRRLAELQQSSFEKVDVLLSSGCYDQRLSVLRTHIPAVMDYLEEAMLNQRSCNVLPLGKMRLKEMAKILEDACFCLGEIGVSSALLHNDINPGNVLVGNGRIVFTDWAEASIGHPFVAFEQFRVRATADDRMKPWMSQLTKAYKSSWRSLLTGDQIERAFRVVALVGAFSYLYGRGDWLSTHRRNDPLFQGHTRGIARYMDRAATAFAQGDFLCA